MSQWVHRQAAGSGLEMEEGGEEISRCFVLCSASGVSVVRAPPPISPLPQWSQPTFCSQPPLGCSPLALIKALPHTHSCPCVSFCLTPPKPFRSPPESPLGGMAVFCAVGCNGLKEREKDCQKACVCKSVLVLVATTDWKQRSPCIRERERESERVFIVVLCTWLSTQTFRCLGRPF